MIEQNGLDPMFGKERDEDDQDIIELTEEVAALPTTDDEEIIELTSEVERPAENTDNGQVLELTSEVAETAVESDDEEILELTSEVEETIVGSDEEDILELTSEVEEVTEETDREEILELTSEVDEISEKPVDEDVLELTSVVEEVPGETDMTLEGEISDEIKDQQDETEPAEATGVSEDEEDLLNLLSDERETSAASQPVPAGEEESMVDNDAFQEPADMASEIEPSLKDIELASVMGVELDPARDLSLESPSGGIEVELHDFEKNEPRDVPNIIIPRKQLEAAIERAVELKLAAKIDVLLTDAIEKAVTKEISRLKRLLTDDLPDD